MMEQFARIWKERLCLFAAGEYSFFSNVPKNVSLLNWESVKNHAPDSLLQG